MDAKGNESGEEMDEWGKEMDEKTERKWIEQALLLCKSPLFSDQ